MKNLPKKTSRRAFLHAAAQFVVIAGSASSTAALGRNADCVAGKDTRSLALENLHTNEHLSIVYAIGSSTIPSALWQLNVFLRDHYTGEVGNMDPKLFDLLYRLRISLGTREPFQIISAYRSRVTNKHLRKTREGGVAEQSLHMQGMAIDLRVPGISLSTLREVAISLQAGGVGFYPNDDFVHIDTGKLRFW